MSPTRSYRRGAIAANAGGRRRRTSATGPRFRTRPDAISITISGDAREDIKLKPCVRGRGRYAYEELHAIGRSDAPRARRAPPPVVAPRADRAGAPPWRLLLRGKPRLPVPPSRSLHAARPRARGERCDQSLPQQHVPVSDGVHRPHARDLPVRGPRPHDRRRRELDLRPAELLRDRHVSRDRAAVRGERGGPRPEGRGRDLRGRRDGRGRAPRLSDEPGLLLRAHGDGIRPHGRGDDEPLVPVLPRTLYRGGVRPGGDVVPDLPAPE